MYRSSNSSISRAYGEFLVDISATGLGSPSLKMADSHDLPIHHSVSNVAKKEMSLQGKPQGQKAIHLIPVVLIFCGLILWVFSHH
ncbi:hypothetical protein VNO77_24337 [Canavalia gladiata]|uniref:Uncharacterized protein n=1 Tax=Canavalia gladiata TaxID=3824 RepID=A0AAN9L6U5_CANGL